MITKQHRQEDLSIAYITAIAAKAGYIFDRPSRDYGADGSIKHVKELNGRYIASGHSIDIQLKATTTWSVRDDMIVYDLEAKTYNDIVERFNTPHATPLILVVLCLPADENHWLDVTQDQLVLKRCCYWCLMTGQRTTNEYTQRIEIPTVNIFNPETVKNLLQKIVDGEVIS